MSATATNLPHSNGRCKSVIAVVSLIFSAIALLVAIFSLVLQWRTSPLFEANASELAYWYLERNVVEPGVEKRESKLTITLRNKSWKPAHEVKIFVKPLSTSPVVRCDAKHDVQDSVENEKLITIHRIPASSSVTIELAESVDHYELVVQKGKRIDFSEALFGHKYRYVAKLLRVQAESGDIRADFMSCQSDIDLLPDDLRWSSEGMVGK